MFPPMVGVMATSSKRSYARTPRLLGLLLLVSLTPWQATVDPRLCQRLPNTHRQVWVSLLWGHCSFLLGLVCTSFCFCPSRNYFPLVLWKYCNQILLTFKVRFPGDSQSLCWIPRLGSLLWGLELLQQCEIFFGVIILPFVDRPPGGSMVGLMVTSSSRTCTTSCASQAPTCPSHLSFNFCFMDHLRCLFVI